MNDYEAIQALKRLADDKGYQMHMQELDRDKELWFKVDRVDKVAEITFVHIGGGFVRFITPQTVFRLRRNDYGLNTI